MSGFTSRRLRSQHDKRLILTYHGFDSNRLSKELFEQQLTYLEKTCRLVSLEELLSPRSDEPADRPRVALTFDDGLKSNFWEAYPILRERGIPATFFVCPGLIESQEWLWVDRARYVLDSQISFSTRDRLERWGLSLQNGVHFFVEWMKTLPNEKRAAMSEFLEESHITPGINSSDNLSHAMMTWEELSSLDPNLITIGSHTVTHPILENTSKSEVARELADSKEILEQKLQRSIRYFSYPDSSVSQEIAAMARECYSGAFTLTNEAVPPVIFDRATIPRVCAPYDLDSFAWLLQSVSAPLPLRALQSIQPTEEKALYFFFRNYYPSQTGASERFRRYIPHLTKLGFAVFVITVRLGDLPDIEETENETIIRLDIDTSRGLNISSLLKPAIPFLIDLPPGVIQIPEVSYQYWGELIRLRRAGHRVVVARTIVPEETFSLGNFSGIKHLCSTFFESYLVDTYVAGSTAMRDTFTGDIPHLHRKYRIVPHGIDLQRFRPGDTEEKLRLRNQFDLPSNAPLILSVGTINNRKRTHLAIEAFKIVLERQQHAQLLLVGENSDRDSLFSETSKRSFSDYNELISSLISECPPGSVRCEGEVENIEEYYRMADLFLFTSRLEGLPNAFIEAMASGLPIVSTRFAGFPHSELGTPDREFTVSEDNPDSLASAMTGLLESEDRSLQFAKAARKFAENHLDIADSIQGYAQAYHGNSDSDQ